MPRDGAEIKTVWRAENYRLFSMQCDTFCYGNPQVNSRILERVLKCVVSLNKLPYLQRDIQRFHFDYICASKLYERASSIMAKNTFLGSASSYNIKDASGYRWG